MNHTSDTSLQRYSQRIQAVERYIHEHLDDAIDLNRLADIACLSPYHWHRVYHAMQGETIHTTVTRLRLQRAAHLLTSTELPLTHIARKAGYSAAPPFSRAFKAAYGVSPVQYRNTGPHRRYSADDASVGDAKMNVRVENRSAFDCVAVSHTGSYMEIDKAFSTLFRELMTQQVLDDNVMLMGVYFDDPDMVAESRLESLACAAMDSSGRSSDLSGDWSSKVLTHASDEALQHWRIPEGPHAVLRHQGPYDGLPAAYAWLFGPWLTHSDREPADEPAYEVYINNPRDTAPMDLLVDICLPLRA